MAYNITISRSGFNTVTCGITCDTSNSVCMSVSCVSLGGCSITGSTSAGYTGCTYSSGQTLQLGYTYTSGSAVTSAVWNSNNTNICTVSNSGLVTFKTYTGGNTGVTITCTLSNSCSSCAPTVTVKNPFTQYTAPSNVSVTGNTYSTSACTPNGATLQLGASYTAGTGPGGTGSWTSEDTNTATVNNSGLVTFKKAGCVYIKYTRSNDCGSASGHSQVCCAGCSAPTGVSISGDSSVSSSSCTYHSGQTIQLTGSYSGNSCYVVSGSWSAQTTSVATVSVSGLVTFKTTGSTVIKYTATNSCGSKSAEKTVTNTFTQRTAPSNVSINGLGTYSTCTSSMPYDITLSATYNDGTGGGGYGTWTIESGVSATINSSGVLHFTKFGQVSVGYVRTNNCGSAAKVTGLVTLNPDDVPAAPTITGPSCATVGSGTITVVGADVYQSSNTNIATVTNAGVVTPVAAGSVTISGKTSNVCGDSAWGTKSITIYATPTIGNISGGATTILTGASTTWSATATNGTANWRSSNTSVATVNSSGVITGVGAGSATIYVKSCNACGNCSGEKSRNITVINCVALTGASVSGTATTGYTGCTYSSGQTLTLSSSYGPSNATNVSGPTWSSANSNIATVSNGTVTFKTTGSTTIYAVYSNDCSTKTGSTTVTNSFTQYTSPSVTSISATNWSSAGCNDFPGCTVQATASYTAGTHPSERGTWSIQSGTAATVNSSGLLTFTSTGTVTVRYTRSGGCSTSYKDKDVTASWTKYTKPSGVSISGNATVSACTINGATIQLTESHTAGTGPNGSGSWSSSATGVATVNSSGLVTFKTTGSTTITFTYTNDCGSASNTKTVTGYQYTKPSGVSISGNGCVCVGNTITLTADYTAGTGPNGYGTWTSSATGVATINTSGVVTGVAAGTTTITYTRGNDCGSASNTKTITVYKKSSSVSISGGGVRVNAGSGVTLTGTSPQNSGGSGTWVITSGTGTLSTTSGTQTVAKVTNTNSSITVKYTATEPCSCGSATASTTIYSYGKIADGVSVSCSGGGSFCCGSTKTITGTITNNVNASLSKSFSSNDTTNLPVNSSSGVVSGNAPGKSATITCTVTDSYGNTTTCTQNVSTYPSVASVSISGAGTACCGGTITLTGSYTSGISVKSFEWSSNNTNVVLQAGSTATSAVFKFNAANQTATITYKITSCDNVSKTTTATIYSYPSVASVSVSSNQSYTCCGSTATLTGSYTSGISVKSVEWSSNNANVVLQTSGNTSATYKFNAAGQTATITYKVTSCDNINKTNTVTIYSYPSVASVSISNAGGYTCCGSTVTLGGSYTSGISVKSFEWSSNNTNVVLQAGNTATSATFKFNAANQTATITYKITSCDNVSKTTTATIYSYPSVASASISGGGGSTCCGSTVSLTGSYTSNISLKSVEWSSNNANVVLQTSGNTSATYKFNAANQTATISYKVTSCDNISKTGTTTVYSYPSVASVSISGGNVTVCCGSTVNLTGSYTNGISFSSASWSSNNANVVIQSSGNTTATCKFNAANQTAIITYTVTSCDGVNKSNTTTIYSYPSISSASIDSGNNSKVCCGNTITLTGSWAPSTMSLNSVSWSSSNADVVLQSSGNTSAVFKLNAPNQSATITYTVKSCDGVSKSATATIGSYKELSSASIAGSTHNLCNGGTVRLTGSYSPTDNLTTVSESWSTSDATVATISKTTGGSTVVTAKKANAQCTITYVASTCNGSKSATWSINVWNPLSSVTITGGSHNLCNGGTTTLSASYTPTSNTGNVTTGWTTSDATVATVTSAGVVTAKKANAQCTITFTATGPCNTVTDDWSINVWNPLTEVRINHENGSSSPYALCEGATLQLSESSHAPTANTSTVTGSWSTSDSNVATVSSSGLVTAKNGAGTCYIRYTLSGPCNSVSRDCYIYVRQNISGNTVQDKSSTVIYGGGSCNSTTVTYSYTPTNTDMGSTSFTVDKTNLATVSYTGGTSGTATITGKADTSAASSETVTITYSVTDYCNHTVTKKTTFTVRQHITGLTLNNTSKTLVAGKNETKSGTHGCTNSCDVSLTATFTPSNAYGISYNWSTSNSDVATISATTGATITVHGVRKGSATITCTATDGCGTSKSATCTITVKNPCLNCLTGNNITVTCGSTASMTISAWPQANVGNASTESVVNVTGWTITASGTTDANSQGNASGGTLTAKTTTLKTLEHGTGCTLSITGRKCGLYHYTIKAVDDNGSEESIDISILIKYTGVSSTNHIATKGWINTYRYPLFPTTDDLTKVPRKTDIVSASSSRGSYVKVTGTYDDTQAVKESDIGFNDLTSSVSTC